MSFPYTYKKSLIFTLKNKFRNSDESYMQQLFYNKAESKHQIQNIKKSNRKVSFVASVPVLNFNFSVDVFFIKDFDDVKITYETNLEKLITIILVTIILTAFFSFVSIKYFFVIAGILAISLYVIFYLIIDNFIQRLIKDSLEGVIESYDEAEKFSDEQIKWINDDTRCSACGSYLSEFDLYCKECGIKLKRNRYTIPLDLSKYKDKEVFYHFKKGK